MRVSLLPVFLLCLIAACQKPSIDDTPGGTADPESVAAGERGGVETDLTNPKKVIDEAIWACGGNSAWQKLKTCRIRYQSVTHMPMVADDVGDSAVVSEDCYSYPDKLRRTVRRESDGTQVLLSVVNGNTMWLMSADNEVVSRPCNPEIACPGVIATLSRLMQMQNSGQAMTLEPTEQYDGREVIPLTILQDGSPQSTTYFDHLDYLAVREVKYLPDMSNPPESLKRSVLAETTYGEHKSFDGVVLPTLMRASQAGKLMFEVKILEVEFPESFPPELFDALKADGPERDEST